MYITNGRVFSHVTFDLPLPDKPPNLNSFHKVMPSMWCNATKWNDQSGLLRNNPHLLILFLKPNICDDCGLRHGDYHCNTLIPERYSLALFRRMQMGWVQRTREQGPGSTATVQILNLFACPLNPLTPHSATQWWKERLGVNAVLLVSVLQTCSLQMFVLYQFPMNNIFTFSLLLFVNFDCWTFIHCSLTNPKMCLSFKIMNFR